MNQTETLEKVKAAFAEYQDEVEAILKDYLCDDPGMFTELAAADEGFLNDVDDLDEGQTAKDRLESLLDEMTEEEILKALDEDKIREWGDDNSYIALKVEGAADRDKLEAFIKQNIYPYNINDLWHL